MRSYLKTLALIGISGLFLLSKVYGQNFMTTRPQYDIGFMNYTGQRLDDVAIYYGNTEVASGGALVKGGRATYGSVTTPIPSEAEVRWDEGDKHYAVKAKLEGVIPKSFSDDDIIYFIINTNGTVDVKPIKFGDTDAVVKLVRSARPQGEYHLGFINKTGRDLENVSAYYGEKKAGDAGNIPVRVRLGYSDLLLPPIPSEAEVRWSDKDGTSHVVKVKLDSAPNGFEGTIYMVIKPDNTIEVRPIKNGDDEGAIKLMK
jgi:hypothetical protein